MSNNSSIVLTGGESIDNLSATGVPTELTLFLKCFMSMVAVLGTFGNILTIISITTNKALRTAPNAYVINLALTDLAVCSILIPVSISFYDGPPSDILCQLIGYPNLVCMVTSIFNMSLVALNRYIVVCRSRDLYAKIYTKRNITISCVASWIITAICFSPPFFGLGTYGYNVKFGTCIFITNDPETYWMIFSFGDSTIIFPTLFITLFCYVNIMLKFRSSQKKVGGMGAGTVSVAAENQTQMVDLDDDKPAVNTVTKPAEPTGAQAMKDQKEKEARKKTMNVIKSLFTIWITFLSFWMPLILTYKIDYYSSLPNGVYHIFYALAQSNSTLNFLIYAMTNRNFREAYKRTLTCGRKGRLTAA